MTTTTKRPTKELIDNFKEMRQKIRRSEQLVLQMIRHPDATEEMRKEVTDSYRRAYADYIQVRDSLREHFPDSARCTSVQYPWFEKENV
jgi:hypothetical protein